jgi:hypothetical protein
VTKTEAKRLVCKCVAEYMDPRKGHDNGFINEDGDGNDYNDADHDRLRDALVDLCDEFLRRAGGPSHG